MHNAVLTKTPFNNSNDQQLYNMVGYHRHCVKPDAKEYRLGDLPVLKYRNRQNLPAVIEVSALVIFLLL
jgi:hypothetical protein